MKKQEKTHSLSYPFNLFRLTSTFKPLSWHSLSRRINHWMIICSSCKLKTTASNKSFICENTKRVRQSDKRLRLWLKNNSAQKYLRFRINARSRRRSCSWWLSHTVSFKVLSRCSKHSSWRSESRWTYSTFKTRRRSKTSSTDSQDLTVLNARRLLKKTSHWGLRLIRPCSRMQFL